jgi:prevent-host-death family protein
MLEAMMSVQVGTQEAKTHLSEYLNRVAYRGERILVERHGKPVAALVSVDDLRRLETIEASTVVEADDDSARQAHFRRLAEQAGLIKRWPSGERDPLGDFAPLELEGPPLSEQIIADRR